MHYVSLLTGGGGLTRDQGLVDQCYPPVVTAPRAGQGEARSASEFWRVPASTGSVHTRSAQ